MLRIYDRSDQTLRTREITGHEALPEGERENMPEIQRNVFRLLRLLDEQRCDFACAPALHGDAALAYMNRMLRASEQI